MAVCMQSTRFPHPSVKKRPAAGTLRGHRPAAPARKAARWGNSWQCSASHCTSSSSSVVDKNVSSTVSHLYALYKFSRPHTMIGTALSVTMVSWLAVQGHLWTSAAWSALALALAAALLANISIVGLNQCYDVAIDRINKPYLPLASGEWSPATAWAIVWLSGALSLAVAALANSLPLVATVAVSLCLGIAYSADVPGLRWKRHPVAAAVCILAVRAIVVQLGFWAHMRVSIGGWLHADRSLIFMTSFMTFFSIVIALFKDIPDVRGDTQYNIKTTSARIGAERVFWICIALLQLAYALSVMYVGCFCQGFKRAAGVAVYLGFSWLLQRVAMQTNLQSHSQLVQVYMFVWKLFYAQYLTIPLIC